jgi:hypothetical protein
MKAKWKSECVKWPFSTVSFFVSWQMICAAYPVGMLGVCMVNSDIVHVAGRVEWDSNPPENVN